MYHNDSNNSGGQSRVIQCTLMTINNSSGQSRVVQCTLMTINNSSGQSRVIQCTIMTPTIVVVRAELFSVP